MDAVVPIDRVERVAIGEATGRVVARDVAAAVDVPPFDRAAMDGYAVVAADTAGAQPSAPKTLRVRRSRVHRPGARAWDHHRRVHRNRHRRTDAAGRGCRRDGRGDDARRASVRIMAAVQPRQHVGRRANDLAIGQTVVTAGQLLSPSRIGALAATGHLGRRGLCAADGRDRVDRQRDCRTPARRSRPDRFTTSIGTRSPPSCTSTAAPPTAVPSAGDSVDDLVRALDAARAADIIVLSGGSSVGDRDLVLDALQRRGR